MNIYLQAIEHIYNTHVFTDLILFIPKKYTSLNKINFVSRELKKSMIKYNCIPSVYVANLMCIYFMLYYLVDYIDELMKS